MSSICVSKSVKDTRIPLRANYVSLIGHKWPESDHAELVKTIESTPRVVDSSISCRQLYLRNAYTFSRKKESTVTEKTRKCFGKVRERVLTKTNNGGGGSITRPFRHHRRRRKRRFLIVKKKVKEFSCEAFCSIFKKLLSCTASVDVVEQNDDH